jgi:CopG family nickel-responsive transcriptional regulator
MGSIRRFSVSVEKEILKLVDDQVRQGAYPNRSEALRAMIRRQAADAAMRHKGSVIGLVGVVFDHHKPHLVRRLLHAQHDTPAKILGAQHFHLDHHHCVESILISGKASDLEAFHKHLHSLRGITYATLSILAPGSLK